MIAIGQDALVSNTLDCPFCQTPMASGWVAMWNPIIGQKVRWQPTQPGYGRLRVPDGAAVVLRARRGGREARVAYRCSQCAAVVVPPDPTYDT